MVNTRLSQKSFIEYKRFNFFTKPMLLNFSTICTQTIDDEQRFKRLGIPNNLLEITGNFKFDQEFDKITENEINKLKKDLNINSCHKIILAGSTHNGEETILIDAFKKIKEKYKNIIFIIVPRDPNRSKAVYNISKSYGFCPILMSESNNNQVKTDFIIIDVIGILRKLYVISDISFVGGSLIKFGGHNPLEPAAFSKPIIFGPYMDDFSQVAKFLLKAKGAIEVNNSDGLYNKLDIILSNENYAKNMGKVAFNIINENKGAVDKTIQIIKRYINNIDTENKNSE